VEKFGGQNECELVSVEPRWAMTVHLAHPAEIFSRGQQSSLFSISFLAKEDWSKLISQLARDPLATVPPVNIVRKLAVLTKE
jgi:hypothetical protein